MTHWLNWETRKLVRKDRRQNRSYCSVQNTSYCRRYTEYKPLPCSAVLHLIYIHVTYTVASSRVLAIKKTKELTFKKQALLHEPFYQQIHIACPDHTPDQRNNNNRVQYNLYQSTNHTLPKIPKYQKKEWTFSLGCFTQYWEVRKWGRPGEWGSIFSCYFKNKWEAGVCTEP